MKYQILMTALFLGILIGITIFMPQTNTITGSAAMECYVENNLCECGENECVCGNLTVSSSYCGKKLK